MDINSEGGEGDIARLRMLYDFKEGLVTFFTEKENGKVVFLKQEPILDPTIKEYVSKLNKEDNENK